MTVTEDRPMFAEEWDVRSPVCKLAPEPWAASADPLVRQNAALECVSCPLLSNCLRALASTISKGSPPAGVVWAGIAFNDEGMPDSDVHGAGNARHIAAKFGLDQPKPLIDNVLIDRALADTLTGDDSLTEDEERETLLRAAELGYPLSRIAEYLHINWRRAKRLAIETGIADIFDAADTPASTRY